MHANYIVFSMLIFMPPLSAMQPKVSSQRQLQEVAISEKQPESRTLATIASDSDIDSDKSSTSSTETPPPLPSDPEDTDAPSVATTLATEIAAKQKLAQENSRLKKEIEKLTNKTEKPISLTEQNNNPNKDAQVLSAGAQGESALEVECCACGKCKESCKCNATAAYGATGVVGFSAGAGLAQAGVISCCVLL